MSHKGPPWVPDYDNTRKCRKEEVSAGSRPPREITLISPISGAAEVPGAARASARLRASKLLAVGRQVLLCKPVSMGTQQHTHTSRTAGVSSETATA